MHAKNHRRIPRFLLLPQVSETFGLVPGCWVWGFFGLPALFPQKCPRCKRMWFEDVWRLPLPQLLFLVHTAASFRPSSLRSCVKNLQNSPVMFPIHRATAVVLRFALQVALDLKATEVTGSWMPVGEKSTLGLGSHTATQRLQPTDWPSHRHQNRSRLCNLPKSRFFNNKSRRPGFVGSILSWSVGEKWIPPQPPPEKPLTIGKKMK